MSTGRPISQRLSMGLEADGSPVRLRTQPPPNRVLDFGAEGTVHKSIESPSPFKPKHVLRRSMGAAHQNPFASPTKDAKPQVIPEADEDAEEEAEAEVGAEEEPLLIDGDDYYDAVPALDDDQAEEPTVQEAPSKAKPGRTRRSGDLSVNSSQIQHTPPAPDMTKGRKRDRSTLEDEQAEDANVSQSQIGETGRASKKQRGGKHSKVIVHQDDGDAYIDPSLLAHGDEYVIEEPIEALEPANKAKGKGKKGKKAAVPRERGANRSMNTQVRINESPSKLRGGSRDSSRGLSVGPISNVHLRATTPFEDAAGRTSRFGRNLMQPLKYWANEMRIYKNGETAGIVRADDVEVPKRKKPKKKGRKAKSNKLGDIDEESETESTHPDEWEEDVGVIAGMVANWDPEKQVGMPEDLIREGENSAPLHTHSHSPQAIPTN